MKKSYKLENLCCANCGAKIESALNKLDCIQHATVNVMTQKLNVETKRDGDDELVIFLEQAEKIIKKYEPGCKIILDGKR